MSSDDPRRSSAPPAGTSGPTEQPRSQPSPPPGGDGRGRDGGESADRAGLDQPPPGRRPYLDGDRDHRPLTVRVQVRIAVGGHADAVAAAQGNALRALLATLPADPPPTTGPDVGPDDERSQR